MAVQVHRQPTQGRNQTPSHYFLHQCINVWQLRTIRYGGKSIVAYDIVQLGLCSVLGVGVSAHGEEERLHGSNCLELIQ